MKLQKFRKKKREKIAHLQEQQNVGQEREGVYSRGNIGVTTVGQIYSVFTLNSERALDKNIINVGPQKL